MKRDLETLENVLLLALCALGIVALLLACASTPPVMTEKDLCLERVQNYTYECQDRCDGSVNWCREACMAEGEELARTRCEGPQLTIEHVEEHNVST